MKREDDDTEGKQRFSWRVQILDLYLRTDQFPSSVVSYVFSYLVANIALRDEKVAASSFRAFSSFLSFIMVSVTIVFSFSYLLFKFASAPSAV